MVDTNGYFQCHLVFVYMVNVAGCFFLGFSNVLFSSCAVSGFCGGFCLGFFFILSFYTNFLQRYQMLLD